MIETVLWLSVRATAKVDSTVNADGSDSRVLDHEQLWDQLVAWCQARHLFAGGALHGAVVYGALAPVTAAQHRQLKLWLQQQAGIEAFQSQLAQAGDLFLLGAQPAGLEAASQAQEFLAARMGECALSLAAITAAFGLRWHAFALLAEGSLEMSLGPARLQLTLRRQDRAAVPAFKRWAAQAVRRSDLERFVPALIGLHWRALERVNDLQVGMWVAEEGAWHLHLCGDPGSDLDHREVMRRWMAWLSLS